MINSITVVQCHRQQQLQQQQQCTSPHPGGQCGGGTNVETHETTTDCHKSQHHNNLTDMNENYPPFTAATTAQAPHSRAESHLDSENIQVTVPPFKQHTIIENRESLDRFRETGRLLRQISDQFLAGRRQHRNRTTSGHCARRNLYQWLWSLIISVVVVERND